VLTWLAVALLTGAAVVAVGWGLRRTDELGRPRRFPRVSVALLLAMGVGAAVPGVLRASQEALAGARVAVRCQSLGGAFVDGGPELGYVRWRADGSPEPWALIKRDQCHHLAAYVRSGARRPTRDQVVAVHVLTHEAMHMSGRLDEAVAECAAVQRDAQTARLLGARPADAAALAAAYWENIYPLMPDRYRSGECRQGGAMDERLADAPWLAPLPA
jgi:sirohydrochlorin ferrochelatase